MEESRQFLSLCNLLLRKRPSVLREGGAAYAGSCAPQIAATRVIDICRKPFPQEDLVEPAQRLGNVGPGIRVHNRIPAGEPLIEILEVNWIEKFGNDTTQIVRGQIGRRSHDKIELGQTLPSPDGSRRSVVLERLAATLEESCDVVAAPVRETLSIPDDHLRQFLECAFGQFHGSD